MNFQALKWMIESLVQTYKCPNCDSGVSDENVDIIWAAWTNINIDLGCPNCDKHSMIKAEMLSFELWPINISKWNMIWLKNGLSKLKSTKNNKYLIKDSEITALNKKLKELKEVSDLFNEK